VAQFFKFQNCACKNGSREPYRVPFGVIVNRTSGLVTINVCATFEVHVFTRYGNTKGNAKCLKYEKSHIKRLAIGKWLSRTLKVITVT